MSAEQFQRANNLIKNRQFHEARALLKTIDHPRATQWLRKLDEIAPPTSTPTQNAVATFECTKCLRAVGPQMRDCDYRDHEQCPFQYVQMPAGNAILGLASMFGGILSGMTGFCLLSSGQGNVYYALMSLVCFVPALLAILYGLFKFAGVQTRIIDPKTGILWHKENVLGIHVRSEKVERSESMALPVQPDFPLKYPPSISGLIADGDDRKKAVRSIVDALLVLAAKCQIDLVQTTRQAASSFGKDHHHDTHFIKLFIKPRGELVLGTLETRIMVTLQQWYDKPKPRISAEGMFLYDLGYNLFVEKKVRDPFAATLAIVRRDAHQSGFMDINALSGTLGKPRQIPNINPELGEQVQIVRKVCDSIGQKYPALASGMETQIKKGLQKRADERRQTELSREDLLRIALRAAFRAISRM